MMEAVHGVKADAVRLVHRAAEIARETITVDQHGIDVQRTQRDAFMHDVRPLVDHHCTRTLGGNDYFDFSIRLADAHAVFVVVEAARSFLAVPAALAQEIADTDVTA
jgi:hypothetical protein